MSTWVSIAAIAAAELADHDRAAQFSLGEIVGRVDQRITQADEELIAVLQHVAPQPIVVGDARRAIEHPVDGELDRPAMPAVRRGCELISAACSRSRPRSTWIIDRR